MVTVTFNNTGGITTIKPDCFNTFFEVTDSNGQLLPARCRIPVAYGIPQDIGPIPASLTCDLAEMYDPSLLAGGTYTVRAVYSNYIQDPDLVNGVCNAPNNQCYALWTGAVQSTPVQVTVDPVTYTLTYTAGSGSSISGDSSQTVASGNSGTEVTADPDAGYHFIDWSDGVLTASRTDTNVTANLSVTANFALNVYTISASAGSGGIINPLGDVNVNYGGSDLHHHT